jgi:hypothetical protein
MAKAYSLPLGRYFNCCQYCIHDGSCELKHHEFMGTPAGNGIDTMPYQGHEGHEWLYSVAQKKSLRAMCTGRIRQTESRYYPLQCECGTSITGLGISDIDCKKFSINQKGLDRKAACEKIAAEHGVNLIDLDPELYPPHDESYIPILRES